MNNFIVLKRLGRGSFGVVYKVKRRQDNVIYALKRVKASSDALNEIRLLASLNHPNIIRYYEAFAFIMPGNRIPQLSIVMEYAEKGDLSILIKKLRTNHKYLSELRIWKYIYQIASALQYLHERHILHRDLKAANCLLTLQDNIKLADLNISKITQSDNLAKTKIGTPYYMSPEIWNNRPYNYQCDIWALGCLVYELACFKVPFTGKSIEELEKNIKRGHYLKRPNKKYSSLLWEIIEKMFGEQPDQRPTTKSLIQLSLSKINVKRQTSKSNVETGYKFNSLLKTIKLTPQIKLLSNRMPATKYLQSDVTENTKLEKLELEKLQSGYQEGRIKKAGVSKPGKNLGSLAKIRHQAIAEVINNNL